MFHNYPFLGGMIIGLILALPTGPGAFMVIKQGIGQPIPKVFRIAFVCMIVDFIWNFFLCSTGDLSRVLVDVLLTHKETIRTWVGPILVFVGVYTFRSMYLAEDPVVGMRKTFFVSIMNPLIPVSLATLLIYFIGGDYFTCGTYLHMSAIAGIFFGEALTWFIGIQLFHWLLLKGLPEKAIPIFFGALFISTGLFLWIKGYFYS